MKQMGLVLKRYAPWLLLLLGIDGFAAVILWLSDIRAFRTLIGLIVMVSLALFGAVLFFLCRRERRSRQLFVEFLTNPDRSNEEKLLHGVSQQEGETLRILASVLREREQRCSRLHEDLSDYETYVEGWAHEAKTPLSLLTMLLDNRGDELPESLRFKLDYVRNQLQEDITQMLYYARLKSSTKDYLFEPVNLEACIDEVLEDYAPLLEEKQFTVQNRTHGETVYTDRRGLSFMLGQIISNAIKYHTQNPVLVFSMAHQKDADVLSVADNGMGVQPWDLPYLFQKGFTGDSTDSRKKATGMGLYLTKTMADDLKLGIEAKSRWKQGFSIFISFPRLRSNP